uniref:RING-type domain-containing protein n=3 Tax=Meloidogyne TaxID=189290 RepID=A0A6V7V292_MELEN|nr:unnamed protein product [Meloidogyne enterolobii]
MTVCFICQQQINDNDRTTKINLCSHAFHTSCFSNHLNNSDNCPVENCTSIIVGNAVEFRHGGSDTGSLAALEIHNRRANTLVVAKNNRAVDNAMSSMLRLLGQLEHNGDPRITDLMVHNNFKENICFP